MKRSPVRGYFGSTGKHLDALIDFLKEWDPDVLGLVEVDAGSFRSERENQARKIAEALGHHHTYKSKYPEEHPLWSRIPVLNKQGNAFISKDTITREQFHYVTRGVKRLVLELELQEVVFLLVHLALSFQVRQQELRELKRIVKQVQKPCIVAGDFNVMTGHEELELFKEAAGLTDPSPVPVATYPSWNPSKELDFILHSPGIRVQKVHTPQVEYSDHLPLICDFEVPS